MTQREKETIALKRIRVLLAVLIIVLILSSIFIALRLKAINIPPVASFFYSLSYPQPDVPVTFNASESYDPDGTIVSYRWDFGDGSIVSLAGSVTDHTYSNDGTYQVRLQVQDNGGSYSTMALWLTVNSNVWFRVVDPSGNPISNVTVTVYKGDSPTATNWQIAPATNTGMEVKYDYVTQPHKANSDAERFRNPGITASILDISANIGFETHPPNWYTFFKFQWGSNVFYWPNETSRVFSYKNGEIETHYYNSGHEAVFNSAAGTYVIKTRDIPGNGVAPAPEHPIVLFGQAASLLNVTINPTNVTMDLGQSKTFNSTIDGGSPPFSYQWYLDDAPVMGATNPTWVFIPTSPGSHTVYLNVTDSTDESAKSNVATIVVNAALSVSIAPDSAILNVNQTQQFTSTVLGGTSPLIYQWFLDGVPVSDAKSNLLDFSSSLTGTFHVYLNVTDSLGMEAKSNIATVVVTPIGSLSVLISPASKTLDLGQSQIFTSIVSGGTSPYAYQWYLEGTPVSDATSPDWTFTPTSAGIFHVYLIVTDSLGKNATSNMAIVMVNPALSITISPTSAIIKLGQSQLFTSSVVGGTQPFSYQWYLNGSLVSGVTSDTWTFMPVSTGFYEVFARVTDTVGMVAQSNTAELTVVQSPIGISIVPVSSVINLGQSVFFTSSVTAGTPPFTYQWFFNDAWVPGVSDSTWNCVPPSAGDYTVFANVTDNAGLTAESNVATITVNSALSVSIAPTSVTMDLGQSQLFTASVSGGTSPYSYQWYLNGSIVPGATSISWTFAPISAGFYDIYVNVTDNVGVTAKSNVATATVNAELSVSILPSSATLTAGQSQLFTSTISGGTPPYSCQWYLNGSQVSGANSPTWTFLQPPGTYDVYLNITDNTGMHAKSNVAQVTVLAALSVRIDPPGASIRPGDSVQFTSTVGGGVSPYSYQWYLDGAPVPYAALPMWTFTPTSTGIFNVYMNVTDSLGHEAKSNIARVIVAKGSVGGLSASLEANPLLGSWLGIISLLAAAVLLKGTISRKKRT